MNGTARVMAAMPATARGPEKGWLPSPAATVRTMAKTAPQAAPSRESVGWFMSGASMRMGCVGSDARSSGPGASSAAVANFAPPRGGNPVPPAGGCAPGPDRCTVVHMRRRVENLLRSPRVQGTGDALLAAVLAVTSVVPVLALGTPRGASPRRWAWRWRCCPRCRSRGGRGGRCPRSRSCSPPTARASTPPRRSGRRSSRSSRWC